MAEHSQSHRSLNRRQILKGAAALGGVAATSSFISVEVLGADAAKVSMQLGWLASNGIMGEVVAKRTGIYDELGIELEVTPAGQVWTVSPRSPPDGRKSAISPPARR